MAMSRKEMEEVLKEGGSVLYQGRTISRAEDLPSEADLAKGDPAAEAAAQEKLRVEIARLEGELGKLRQAPAGEQAPAGGEKPPTKTKGEQKTEGGQ